MPSNRISPEEANARVLAGEPVIFVDARNPKAWGEADRKIPGSVRISADDVDSHLKELDRTSTIIAYCTCPNEESSSRVCQTLRDNGYRSFALRGGFDAWVGSEYPTEKKAKAA